MARLRLFSSAACIALGCVALAGCGSGTQSSSRAVSVTLSAPTDGAMVEVRDIVVAGHVHPSTATILVQGRRVRVVGGAFSQPLSLKRRITTIRISGSAAGYASTTVQSTVRYSDSSPSVGRQFRPRSAGRADPGRSAFISRASAVCAQANAAIQALPRMNSVWRIFEDLDRGLVIAAQELRQPRLISPPQSAAGAYAELIRDGQRQDDLVRQAVPRLRAGQRAQALALIRASLAVGRQADAISFSLGLPTCAVSMMPNGD